MQIEEIFLEDYKCFKELSLKLDTQFNLIIGKNGSGKSAILDAITKSLTAYFWGLNNDDLKPLTRGDIRILKTKESVELADVATIITKAYDSDIKKEFLWKMQIFSKKKAYNIKSANEIVSYAQGLNQQIKDENRKHNVSLPLIAFYSTARLWKEGRKDYTEKKKQNSDSINNVPSRYRGYKDSLQVTSNFTTFLEWFRGKEQARILKKEDNFQLECVRKAVVKNIPGCANIYWEFDPDISDALMIQLKEGPPVPYSYLSDGYRNLLAMFADIAWRSVTLNPHYKEEASEKTAGIVLIDELDLHLHPAWQQDIVQNLKTTFPKIQFIATTHSPFIIQEMEDNEIIKLDNEEIIIINGANRLGIEDIAEDIQDVDTPNMSKKRERMFVAAEKYYTLLEKAQSESDKQKLQELKDSLDEISELYSDDVAYYAFLKQERIARGVK